MKCVEVLSGLLEVFPTRTVWLIDVIISLIGTETLECCSDNLSQKAALCGL